MYLISPSFVLSDSNLLNMLLSKNSSDWDNPCGADVLKMHYYNAVKCKEIVLQKKHTKHWTMFNLLGNK